VSEPRILRAFQWVMAQHLVRLATGLVTSLGLARALGPTNFGTYQMLMSWLLVFVALSTGGLQSVVIQKLAVNKFPQLILGTVLQMRLAWTGLALLFCLLIPWLRGWSSPDLLGMFILAPVLFCQLADLPDYYFQSRTSPRPMVIARTTGSLLSLAVMGWGIWIGAGLPYFFAAFLVEQLVALLLLFVFYRGKGPSLRSWRFDPQEASELWRDSWPMLGATLGLLLYTRIDLVMLKSLATPEETGFFAASSRLSQMWAFLPMAIVTATFPSLARLRTADPPHYAQQSKIVFQWLGLSGWILALILSLGAMPLTHILFGDAYLATAPMLAMQGWITLCYFLRTGLDRWLVTEQLTRYSLVFHLTTAAINIGLNYILIPRFGGWGAALASLVAMASGCLLFPWCSKATRPVAKLILRGCVPFLVITKVMRRS